MAIVITKQPRSVMVDVGSTVLFSVEATGEGLMYQWEYNMGSSWRNSTQASATSATLTLKAQSYHNTYKYRCLITDANGDTLRTDEVVLLITTESGDGFVEGSTLAAIADAIRAKTETTESMLPSEMARLIAAISTGVELPPWISEIEFVQATALSQATLSVPCNLTDVPQFVLIVRDPSVSALVNYETVCAMYWYDFIYHKSGKFVLFTQTSASAFTTRYSSFVPSISNGVIDFPGMDESTSPHWIQNRSYNVIMGRYGI